jgi:hypothetical protein
MKFVLKLLLVAAFLTTNEGTVRAAVIYQLSVDLFSLNPGSLFFGSTTLGSQIQLGGSTPITLVASPAADYSPSTLNTTLSIGPGPTGFYSASFSPLIFTDNSTGDAEEILVNVPALCPGTPASGGPVDCQTFSEPSGNPPTDGQWIGGSGVSGLYSVSIESVVAPETGTEYVLAGLGIFVVFRRSLLRIAASS